MKVVCKKDVLTEHVNIVLKAVSNRTTLPILECVLFMAESGGFKLLANDLELGIETKPAEADILTEGTIALDARVFSDIVRRLPGDDVTIESMHNYITVIKSGGSEFRILGQSGGEFPLLPKVEADACFEIPSAQLKNIVKQTIFSVSSDESKPTFTGELFEIKEGVLKVASTDGFRISVRHAVIDNSELNVSAIVPGKTLGEILKILPSGDKSFTSVYLTDKHILFETEDARIVSRLIEGVFLDFERAFYTDCTTYATVNCSALCGCLERASLISREAKKNSVKLRLSSAGQTVVVESNTETGTFYEEIPAVIDGMDIEIKFNPRYLTDIMKAADEEKVQMHMTTPLSPCIIKNPDNEAYKYLVLPLRN